ncbi:MAG: PspC domain-containing protein [Oscillospiraceae bacterium]|nr:PspC domain-containing protein [Oscillospiraceae bacterium]
MEKKLHKSSREKMLFGVCGGIAEYLDLDPTVVRIALVAFSALGGSGLAVYIACAILMPEG